MNSSFQIGLSSNHITGQVFRLGVWLSSADPATKWARRSVLTLMIAMVLCTGQWAFAVSEQVITPEPIAQEACAESAVSVDVRYSTANPTDETLTGLGLRLHYDSSKLTFGSLTDVLTTAKVGEGQPESDTSDFDGDPSTDMFVQVAWADFAGNWPGAGTTPALLYRVHFTAADNFEGSTTIRFTGSSTAAGYALSAQSATVTQCQEVCLYTVSPVSTNVTASGGVGSLSVSASATNCAWTAADDAAWITLNLPTNGVGNGSVNFTVSENTSTNSRTGHIYVADKTNTITQAGVTVTNYVLNVSSLNPSIFVSIGVNPADVNSLSNGLTPFQRTYATGTAVTLTAPTTAGGNAFQKWQRNGNDYTTSLTANVTMTTNWTMTAVYVECATLPTPNPIQPSCGITASSSPVNLSWTPVANASGYLVEVFSGGSCFLIKVFTATPGGNSVQFTPSGNGTYSWHVKALGNGTTYCESDWSTCCSFNYQPPQPQIGRSPVALTNTVLQGQNASNQTFQVWNAGQGTLSYTITNNVPWLSVSPTNGTSTGESNTIQVSYNTTGLSEGVTNATILVAGNVNNSPQAIQVTLIVVTNGNISCTLAEALDNTGLSWSNTTWECQNVMSHDGSDAAISGEIGDSQSSTFSTVVEGPGTINFWWKVSSEQNFDFLRFSINGVQQAAISGEVDWRQTNFVLNCGSNLLTWTYQKDVNTAHLMDAGFVDQVQIVTSTQGLNTSWSKAKAKCKNDPCTIKAQFVAENPSAITTCPTRIRYFLSADPVFQEDLDCPLSVCDDYEIPSVPAGKKAKMKLVFTVPKACGSASGKYVIAVIGPCGGSVSAENVKVYGPMK